MLPVDPVCKTKVDGRDCGGKHGKWYHEPSLTTSHSGNVTAGGQELEIITSTWTPGLYEVLLANVVSEIERMSSMEGIQTKQGMTLIDPGSDTDFIRNDFAKDLGLKGEPVTCFLKVVGYEHKMVPTTKYNITLVDRRGNLHIVTATRTGRYNNLTSGPGSRPH